MATTVDVKKLLEAGAHFGHKTSRWHPKMDQYIHSKRSGSHIIDLTQTAVKLEEALVFLEKTAGAGKQVLFVGTKRQAKDIVRKGADDTGMPFVTERWIGGMLTNTATMNGRIKHLKDLEVRMDSGALEAKYSKLEVQRYQEEIDRMNFMYGGIKHMANKPGALYVVDVPNEMNAIREAKKLSIPVVAITDTNADPSLIDYVIPANDDAIKTIQLITDYVVVAVNAGKVSGAKKAEKTERVQEDSKAADDKDQKTEPSEDKEKVLVSA